MMKKAGLFIAFLCLSPFLKSQTINAQLTSSSFENTRQNLADRATDKNEGQTVYDATTTNVKKGNNGNLNVGFTNWSFAETGKDYTSPQSPWQFVDQLTLYGGYENDHIYGYLLYTFNDNSVGGWVGIKFRLGNEVNSAGKPEKKWDLYAVCTEYPRGDSVYFGLGLEHTWDIIGPLSISYFVESGIMNNSASFSTGFMINVQQGILRKQKKSN